jgi:hypothetical protein
MLLCGHALMEAADALELMASEMAQIDAAFQFWLASTFAVIIAIHATRESIEIKLKTTITFLYVLLTIYSLVKTVGDFQQLSYLDSFVMASGVNLPNDISAIAGLLRFALYGLGSIATILYIWLSAKKVDST